MENQLTLESEFLPKKVLISTGKFAFLSVITFGLYIFWWTYKSWAFFKEREDFRISPPLRTVFSIFFMVPLFRRIERLARSTGYTKSYSAAGLFICLLVFNGLSYLPPPYYLLSVSSFICVIPPFEALNYAIENTENYDVEYQDSFNNRQYILIALGGLLWLLTIMGLLVY